MAMAKKLISEQAVIDVAKRGEQSLFITPGTIVTDAARDRARQLGIRISTSAAEKSAQVSSVPATAPSSIVTYETIALGSDHGGFAMKQVLKTFIEGRGYKVVDLGTYSEDACDYPDFAYAVARMVSLGEASKGIMIDSVGIASAMVANKIKSIRAACCADEFSARSSREHNNANVLTLGGKVIGVELAKAITTVWLETSFGGGRHQKRVDKITEIEKRSIQ